MRARRKQSCITTEYGYFVADYTRSLSLSRVWFVYIHSLEREIALRIYVHQPGCCQIARASVSHAFRSRGTGKPLAEREK